MATIDFRQFRPFTGTPQSIDLIAIQSANSTEAQKMNFATFASYLAGGGGTTYITQGTNVTITGTGTFFDPYIINASGGGGGGTVTPSSTDTFTNKTISGSSNTLSNIPESAVTNLTSDLASKIGAATSDTLTNKNISGATNTLTAIPLSTAVTGTLPIANGGTGQTSAATIVSNLVSQVLTTAIAATWTITTGGIIPITTVNPAGGSTLTAVTIVNTDLINGGIIKFSYQKTTASDLVITFPSGTLINDQNGNEVISNAVTLSSSATGIFHIEINNFGGSYFAQVIRKKA